MKFADVGSQAYKSMNLGLGRERIEDRRYRHALQSAFDTCVFRKSVTDRFGIVTAEFGNVTEHFGDVTDGSL